MSHCCVMIFFAGEAVSLAVSKQYRTILIFLFRKCGYFYISLNFHVRVNLFSLIRP